MQKACEILKDKDKEEHFNETENGILDPPGDSRSCVGHINISFPEAISEFGASQVFPPSYYTLSQKERLLLLYAENFRHQFVINNHKSRPLVLALPNECNIQKFVCTTIRPTSFLHIPLRTAEGIASFVADFIIYEPLDATLCFPNRLISPATLLSTRRGNSFEMATLLCSMLIGVGFGAVIVSGVARTDVVENDQSGMTYPSNIHDFDTEISKWKASTEKEFSLGAMPDLESQLERNIAKVIKQKEDEKQQNESFKREQEELEMRAMDRYHYRRIHAWVAIIENASGIVQPKETCANENADVIVEAPKARFIETSTGFFRSSSCMEYILIDSVWNQSQYYVNKQKYVFVGDIRWDLKNIQDWEPVLPGEHSENTVNSTSGILKERHLNTIPSWVSKLHIGEKEFEERFPHLQKTVLYKQVKHQRFSPYFNKDGKVMQLTLFADNAYREPEVDWIFFENRADMLQQMKLNYKTSEIEDNFGKGRKDNLKCMFSKMNSSKPKELFFFQKARRDSTEYLKIDYDRIIVKSKDRRDFCFYQEFEFDPDGQNLKKIIQKFSRNTDTPAGKDIAERIFLIMQEKIHLKFHYAPGALTASTCEISKPPKPDYGLEVIYDKSLSKTFKANNADPEPLQLDMYRLMMDQLKNEDKAKRYFKILSEEISDILDNRKIEMEKPFLKFHVFDSMRNSAARSKRLKQVDEINHKHID